MARRIMSVVCAAQVILSAVFTLAACDDFYSTSWGTVRKYDQSKIKLTQDNLQEWREKAVGNPDLAAALVEKIISELPGKSGAEKAAFQDVGIDLAIEQSGIGALIIDLAGRDLAKIKDASGLKSMLSSVQGKFSGGNGKAAAGNIAAIVGSSALTGRTPQFGDGDQYAAQASPSDVGMAVTVLFLAIASDGISGDTNLESKLPNLTITTERGKGQVSVESGKTPSQEEIALAAYLNLIASDTTGKYGKNPITSGLKSSFNL
jgi:hypothetical protein